MLSNTLKIILYEGKTLLSEVTLTDKWQKMPVDEMVDGTGSTCAE
jgi:hypothetical protein